jgi:hypothetical protein
MSYNIKVIDGSPPEHHWAQKYSWELEKAQDRQSMDLRQSLGVKNLLKNIRKMNPILKIALWSTCELKNAFRCLKRTFDVSSFLLQVSFNDIF